MIDSTISQSHDPDVSICQCVLVMGVGLLVIASIGLVPSSAMAEVPSQLEHQGRLLDDSGEPVTGEHTLTFTIYDSEQGDTILWQGQKTVQIEDSGFYSTRLGADDNPLEPSVFESGDAWLGIAVDGGDELEPRMKLNTVPYASIASRAEDVAEGAISSDDLSDDFEVGSENISQVDWQSVSNKPSGLDDGDDDTLAGLSCNQDQVAVYDGSNWSCRDAIGNSDFAQADQSCSSGQVAVGIEADGSLMCRDETAYDGTDFAVSDQGCSQGEVVTGIDADGNVQCAREQDTTYDGTDFATSGQSCSPGEVVQGIDADGNVQCGQDQETTYDGTDFAVSGQGCRQGEVVTGIDANGNVRCAQDRNTTYDSSDFAVSNQSCSPGEVVTGVDASGNVQCAQDRDTNTTYDGSDFATSDQGCSTGQVVTGVDASGNVQCADDQDTTYSGGNNVSVSNNNINVSDRWVDEGGDTMSGALSMGGNRVKDRGRSVGRDECGDPDSCSFNINTGNSWLLIMGHVSADTDNNEDFTFQIQLDGNTIANSKAGDSDGSTYTSQSVVELQSVSAGSHSINARETHEGDEPDRWRETTITAIEIPK